MFRKFLRIIMAICVCFWICMPVLATEQLGVLRVYPSCSYHTIVGSEVTVYRVGQSRPGGFQLTDGLANWIVEDKDAFSREFLDWLLQNLNALGRTLPVLDGNGAVFDQLQEGLYLVSQTKAAPGYTAFRPFLVSVPIGNQWDIPANPKVFYEGDVPQTGDTNAVCFWLCVMGSSVFVILILLSWSQMHRFGSEEERPAMQKKHRWR